MEQVEVEITGMAITQRYGTLTTGTILRTDAAYAKHLVEEASAAKYVNAVKAAKAPTRAELEAALSGLPGENDDPEYVVRGMRSHFGALFTDADEAAARAAVKSSVKKASEGLTVPQLKEALTAKGIAIPDGALKPELVELLDKSAEA